MKQSFKEIGPFAYLRNGAVWNFYLFRYCFLHVVGRKFCFYWRHNPSFWDTIDDPDGCIHGRHRRDCPACSIWRLRVRIVKPKWYNRNISPFWVRMIGYNFVYFSGIIVAQESLATFAIAMVLSMAGLHVLEKWKDGK